MYCVTFSSYAISKEIELITTRDAKAPKALKWSITEHILYCNYNHHKHLDNID